MSGIDDIEKGLLGHSQNASVDELSKIAAAMKDVADTRLTETNIQNKRRETRLELLKSLSLFLVPIVSLLALFGTVVSQNMQMEASRQQVEDTEWRDLLTSLKTPTQATYSDPTVAPRLRSFFLSPTYADQAKSIAGRLMGQISNPDGFSDLFAAVFGEVNAKNIDSVLDISRALRNSEFSIQTQCDNLLNAAAIPFDKGLVNCGDVVSESEASALVTKLKAPGQTLLLRHSLQQIDLENHFLTQRILEYLRIYSVPRDRKLRPSLDLSRTDFILVNFSHIDFSDFNMSGTVFDTVQFNGAILDPRNSGQFISEESAQPDFRGSTWWEALFINRELLGMLLERFPPYSFPDERYPYGYSITIEDYVSKVKQLCLKAGMTCPQKFKFGT